MKGRNSVVIFDYLYVYIRGMGRRVEGCCMLCILNGVDGSSFVWFYTLIVSSIRSLYYSAYISGCNGILPCTRHKIGTSGGPLYSTSGLNKRITYYFSTSWNWGEVRSTYPVYEKVHSKNMGGKWSRVNQKPQILHMRGKLVFHDKTCNKYTWLHQDLVTSYIIDLFKNVAGTLEVFNCIKCYPNCWRRLYE